MENQNITQRAQTLAREMVKKGDFKPQKFSFGKLSFSVSLQKDSAKHVFLPPFQIEDHIFCVSSV